MLELCNITCIVHEEHFVITFFMFIAKSEIFLCESLQKRLYSY